MGEKTAAFQPEKFKVFVRYMIQAARDKRCVPYSELENVFGLGHGQVGHYAGTLGDYCRARGLPPLNGLIVNSSDCIPSHGFDWYREQYQRPWGELVSACWKTFHVTTTKDKQVQDFSKRDADVGEFLAGHTKPGYMSSDET